MGEDLGDFIEAAGLLEYDPAAIKKIYSGNPIRLLKRIWQTLLPIGIFLIGVLIDKFFGVLKNEDKAKKRAKEFTDLLVQLGPAFIKAGQALSTRPDLMPGIVLNELSQLQDQLKGFDSELALSCIEEDLNAKISDLYQELDKKPFSAASLGQVHRGVLKTGEQVAVKVQRPGLREQITLDLYIVRNICIWINANIKFIRSDLVALIDELGKRIFEEMDYLNEASNAERFKKLHENNPKIAVPKIYRKYTSRRVLTMEWINGVKLTDLNGVKKLGIDPNELVKVGVDCSLQQLLEHGFFHADPHPGNLLALNNGKLCYLDFGMMSEVEKNSRNGLIKAVVHLVNKNFDKLSEDFVTLGFLSESVNLEPIVPAFESVFTDAIEMGVGKLDFKSVTDDLSGVMYKFPFRVPPYYALIIRSLITLEGIALSVDPNFKILGAAYPYFAKRLIEDPDPQLRHSLREMLFDGKLFNWERLEELIDSASNIENIDINNILDQILDFLFSKKGGLMRDQLVDGVVNKLDSIGVRTVKKLGNTMPKYLQPKRFREKIEKDEKEKTRIILEINPIRKLISILQKLPGFKRELILNKVGRIIKEPDARKMGVKVAKKLAERNAVRLVKVVAIGN